MNRQMNRQYEMARQIAAMLLWGRTCVCCAYRPEDMRDKISMELLNLGVSKYEDREVLLCGLQIRQMF